jgi:hypothetical protein
MAREITMNDLMQRQRAMVQKAESLLTEKDVDRIQRLTGELERDGKELEQLALDFEKQELAKAGPPPRGSIEVMLTPDQRQRVYKLTGVELQSVHIADEMGVLSKAMPATDPRDIELLAIQEARKLKAMRDADGKMRADVDRAILDIEEQGTAETRQLLAKLKSDPTWLGGILHKK